jgi:hypothetical protein
VNCASWWEQPNCIDQIFAAGGQHMETVFTPTGISSDQVENLVSQIDTMSQTPHAVYDTFGSACFRGLGDYWDGASSPGNYPTQRIKYNMTRYAMFMLVREVDGRPGHAYYDTTFCPSAADGTGAPGYAPGTGMWQDFRQDWFPAAMTGEASLGIPLAATLETVATGNESVGTCSTHGAADQYRIFRRRYTNGDVYFYPHTHWDCRHATAFGAANAKTFALGDTYRMLNHDGTYGPNVTSLTLLPGEAVILCPSP